MPPFSPWLGNLTSSVLLTTCLATLLGCSGPATPEASNSASPSSSPAPTPAIPTTTPVKKTETTRKVEAKLQELVKADLPVALTSVSCPDGIEIAAGKTYRCQAVIEPGQFTVKVAIKDDTGKFQLQTEGLLLLTKVEDLFEKSIKAQNQLAVKADCGSKVRLFQKIGEEFQCQLTTPNGKQTPGQVKVTDLEGGVDVSWKLKK